jgi:hypothetical protein
MIAHNSTTRIGTAQPIWVHENEGKAFFMSPMLTACFYRASGSQSFDFLIFFLRFYENK